MDKHAGHATCTCTSNTSAGRNLARILRESMASRKELCAPFSDTLYRVIVGQNCFENTQILTLRIEVIH